MEKRQKRIPGSCFIRCIFHSLVVVLGAVLVFLLVYHSTDNRITAIRYQMSINNNISLVVDYQTSKQKTNNVSLVVDYQRRSNKNADNKRIHVESLLQSCDFSSGKWVFDKKSYPIYKDRDCKFMFDDLACEKYGRKDLNYQYWRWQPHSCDLPRFNAKALLEKLRGKRLVFVGDSINRNQWVSMICLVESSIPKKFKHMRLNGSLYTFKASPEYNASIDFYWAPLLVESNADDPSSHRTTDRIVKLQSIEKHARQWSDADIVVFNSYLWWRLPKLKVLRRLGSFESSNIVYKEVQMLRIYKKALKTWSDWLDAHINRAKTRLFFVSMSPTHIRSEEWGFTKDQRCLKETQPISKAGYWGSGSDIRMMSVAEDAITKLQRRGLKVQMVNITQLSEYRKDGHPSIYRKQWRPLTKEQLSDPRKYADCTHWCLPGVPDVWNQFLYAYIFQY